MLQTIWLGLLAGLALAIPMGAMSLLLINTAISRGRNHGIAGGAAMASVDGLYAFLATSAGLWLTAVLQGWSTALSIGGAILLGAMAFDLWRKTQASTAPGETQASGRGSVWVTYGKFFGATMLNPPTALYFLSLAPALATYAQTQPLSTALTFALSVLVGSLLWQQALALGAAWVGGRLTLDWRKRIGYAGAALILAMAGLLVWVALA